ncbi:MAG: hypothetical protein HYU67_02130 [Flavobacteriia bacterium]|nr:hypothetical protein [Flavobacteriia bacterium]
MSDKMPHPEEDKQMLLLFIWRKRKIISIICSIVFVISTVWSFLMTPLFLSTAIVFPTATSTVSFSEQRNAKASSMDFGEEEQAEQLLQILSSSRIRNIVVERFDLMKNYEIETNDPNKYFKLGKAYQQHITFTRTKFGSIQIDVLDKNPELSTKIANKIVDLIDTVKNQIVKERTIPAFEINKRKKELLEIQLKNINHKMDSLSSIGVVNSEARATLFQAYNEAKSTVDKAYFKSQLDVNTKHGAEFEALKTLSDEKTLKLAEFEESYEQAESDAYTDFNHKFVVEGAVVPDKKDKPKRLIIIIVSTLSAFIFSIFLLLIQDRIKLLQNKE